MPQCFLNLFFRFHIHRRGRIVQNQNRRPHRRCALAEIRCFCPPERPTPRSPTTVSYPSGIFEIKSDAADILQIFPLLRDQCCCLRRQCCPRSYRDSQQHILCGKSDLFARVGQSEILHRYIIDPHFPFRRLIKPRDKDESGDLSAASGSPVIAMVSPRFYGKRDIMQHRKIPIFILKGYLESIFPSKRSGVQLHQSIFDETGIINLHHFLGCGREPLKFIHDISHLAHRVGNSEISPENAT